MGLEEFKWNNESMKQDAIAEKFEKERLGKMFEAVKGTNAEFGKDGDLFFYKSGNLPEDDCIVGFGDTPKKALEEFYKSFEGK